MRVVFCVCVCMCVFTVANCSNYGQEEGREKRWRRRGRREERRREERRRRRRGTRKEERQKNEIDFFSRMLTPFPLRPTVICQQWMADTWVLRYCLSFEVDRFFRYIVSSVAAGDARRERERVSMTARVGLVRISFSSTSFQTRWSFVVAPQRDDDDDDDDHRRIDIIGHHASKRTSREKRHSHRWMDGWMDRSIQRDNWVICTFSILSHSIESMDDVVRVYAESFKWIGTVL